MSCLFNSYDPYFKQPFGAVRAGQTVRLSLCIPEELGYVDPHLVLQKEGKYDVPVHYRMKFDGQTPHQNHFSVDVVLGDPGEMPPGLCGFTRKNYLPMGTGEAYQISRA